MAFCVTFRCDNCGELLHEDAVLEGDYATLQALSDDLQREDCPLREQVRGLNETQHCRECLGDSDD